MRIYADTVFKESTVYSIRKYDLCIKISHALTKLITISVLGGTDGADFIGWDPCGLTYPHLA